MDFHKLLQKQIKKHLTDDCVENPSFKAFIKSVNDSYLAFERDKIIMDHTFEESEKEYYQINDQLKKEIELKQLAANNLYKSINKEDLNYDINYEHNDDLLFVSEYLSKQISKRKETEKQLHETVELLKTLLANFQSAVRAEDKDRKILFANQLYCNMRNTKLTPDEMVGMNSSKFKDELGKQFKDSERLLIKTNKTLRDKKLVLGELLETQDNHFIERDYIPLFIDDEYRGHLWKYTDVTSKIQTLKLLEQSEEHNRLIMNSSLNSIITVDDHRKITFWNQQAETIFGWKKEEVLGKPIVDLLIPLRYRDMWDNLIDQYEKEGKNPYINKQLELILNNKAGKEFYGETSIIPIYQAGKSYFCTFIQDITKRKEAEKQLYKNASFLNNLLANMYSGVLVFDDDNKVLFINQRFCDLRKIKNHANELIGKDVHDLISSYFLSAKESENYVSRMLEIMKAKQIIKGEIIEGQDGQFIERDYIPIKISSEETIHLWKIEDITQRMLNQRLLEQSEERTQIIMNSALNAIITVNDHGQITFWNDQAETIFGWKEEEVLGRVFTEFMIPAQNKELWDYSIYQYLSEGHNDFLNKQVELIGVKKNGSEFLAEITITPITQNGETFFCGFLQDISQRKETERQLLQTVELLKTLLANLQSGVLVEDENQRILFSNQLFWNYKNKKFSPSEMEGIKYSESVEENQSLYKNSERFAERINKILNVKKAVTAELIETSNNHFLERDYVPIFLNNEYKGHLWKYTDVTQRMQNQKLLKQSEIRSKLIMNASLNAIVTIDINEKITFWNYQATTIFGWTRKEMFEKNMSEIILPQEYLDQSSNEILQYTKISDIQNLKKPIELKAITKKGNEVIIELSVIPIKANDEIFFCASIQDISERKEAEYIRKIQEEKYQNIIANMNLGLLEVDNTEHIKYANQSFAAMSGYEVNELIGKKPSDFFVFGKNLDVIKSKTDSREQGNSDLYQISIKNKRGELKWWAISGAPNYDNKGNLIGSIGIHLDITEQKQLEIDLEIEKANAIESSKAKEVFLANMSHEIRTPLNAIIGFLRELDKQELTELQKKYIDNSTIASKHLLAIINNILDISKIEAGEMSLENVDFVFENSITNVSKVLQPIFEQKGLKLNVSISNKTEKVLKGDPLRLQQILFNLVGNSIKFTNIGSISIDCEVINTNSYSQQLKISVSDTGIGMESSFLENIFNKFSQEDKAVTRKYGGTGLGLSITKELVKLMNGRIEIESKKNVGTSIHLYIDFQKGNKDNVENLNTENSTIKLDNISILLVEDNYLNRMVAQNSLQYYNCKVTEAENGLEAIKILKKNKFDIILMDIQMPQMGGLEATEIIRKELKLTTPIIAFTANAFKTEIDKCKKAGMDDYVTKPFDEDILIETIAKYTVNKNLSRPESLQTEKLYDLSSLFTLSRGNSEFVIKMSAIFVEQTTDIIKKATTAINLNDFAEASRLIHKIRPSVESLGIKSIIKELKHFEKIAKETSDKEQILALFNTIKDILELVIVQLNENELNI